MSKDGVALKLVASIKDLKKGAEEVSTSIQSMHKQAAMMMVSLKKTVSVIKQMTDYTDDYVNSMRLMNVVFGETSEQIKNFINTTSEMTGLDEATLTRQVALFRQLAESIDLTDEYADKFAKGLTTLSAKMAILYNKDYGVMATALQRSIQGTQETLKAMTGIESTELGQQILLTSRGIDRQVSSLNEAERSIVMYASILEQVLNNNKAYEDSVNSVAWQKQMLTAQVKRLGAAIGGLLYPVLQKVLPVFNAILMVLTEIIKIIGTLVGFNIDTTSAVEGTADAYKGLAGGITAAGNAAKKQLRGFDKLNNITTPSKGGGGAGGALGIDEGILKLLDDVDNNFLKIKNKATEIRDAIMDWLGFAKFVDDETGEITWKLKNGYTNIEKIRDALVIIGTVWAGLKIVSIITKATTAFKKLSKVLGAAKGTAGVVGAISALGTKIATAFGVVGLGAVGTFATGLGGILVIIASVYAAIRLVYLAMQDSIKETSLLANTTEETRARLEPVEEAFKNLRDTVSSISYDDLALTEDEKTKIVESITNLTDSMKKALNDYVSEQIKSANHLYYELGVITEEEYKEKMDQISKFKEDSLTEIEEYGTELKTTYETIYDENGNIIQSKYNDFLAKQAKFEVDFMASLAQTAEDSEKIIRKGVDFSKAYTIKGAEEQLQNAKKAKDDRIKVLEEERLKSLEEVDLLFKDDEAKREEHKKKVNEKYDEQVAKAKETYHDIYNEMVVANQDIAKYISEDKAKIKPVWQTMWNGMIDTMKWSISKIRGFWDNLKFNSKKVSVEADTKGPITTYSVNAFASGGFPTQGELFMAREAGPELVGQINGRTAVANNGQIVEGIKSGVYSAMMSALSSKDFGAKVTIEASGDDAGLMNFITFKQREQDRQYN